jgi:hypothetical protein
VGIAARIDDDGNAFAARPVDCVDQRALMVALHALHIKA